MKVLSVLLLPAPKTGTAHPDVAILSSYNSFLGGVMKVLSVLLLPAPKTGTAHPDVAILSSFPGHPNA